VNRQVQSVKILHTILMLVWPAASSLIVFFSIMSFQHKDSYTLFAVVLMIFWMIYSYFMLIVMRNINLQSIAVDSCDFDAYLECMKYLEKFYLNKQAGIGQKVNCTDAYLIRGDFPGAYKNLMELWQSASIFTRQTRMMYDYFWCRFYAELDDAENFAICLEYFRNHWLRQTDLRENLRNKAGLLQQEMNFREMLFQGRNIQAKEYLTGMYRRERLRSQYEFLKYCYFMGRIEFAMANFSVAKHWFAQTVSFGLRDHMSNTALLFLKKLEEMHISYSIYPPENNEQHLIHPAFSMLSGIISILMGFFVMMMLFSL